MLPRGGDDLIASSVGTEHGRRDQYGLIWMELGSVCPPCPVEHSDEPCSGSAAALFAHDLGVDAQRELGVGVAHLVHDVDGVLAAQLQQRRERAPQRMWRQVGGDRRDGLVAGELLVGAFHGSFEALGDVRARVGLAGRGREHVISGLGVLGRGLVRRQHVVQLGHCCDCQRPLCGLHGTAGGELLCSDCVTARADRRQAAEAASQVARERSLEERGRDLSTTLLKCGSADELLELLARRAGAVPDCDALRSAWTRVMVGGQSTAKHEVVRLDGRPSPWSPLTWNDFKRRGTWSESGQRSIVWRAPEAGHEDSLGHTNTDVWIDTQGELWWGAFPATLGFGKNEGPKTSYYVVNRGKRMKLKRGNQPYQTFFTVPDGVPVAPTSPTPDRYVRVVEIALKHGR